MLKLPCASKVVFLAFPALLYIFLPSMATAQQEQWCDALCKAIAESKISGDLRLYNYSRIHNGGGPDTDSSLAAGGDIFLQTGSLAGLSTFLGFYSANYIPTDLPVNETLVGKDHYLNALAQAYLQYYRSDVLVRGGWQVIDTPFARDDMFTMLPRAFGGVSAGIEPLALLNAYPVECLKGQKSNPPKAEDFQASPDQYPHIILFGARMFQYHPSLILPAPERNVVQRREERSLGSLSA